MKVCICAVLHQMRPLSGKKMLFAVTRPDWAAQALRESSLFTLPYDPSLSESSPILVPLRLWDRLRYSSGTNKTQREVCAYPLWVQDMTSPWPVVCCPDLTQHSEFPLSSYKKASSTFQTLLTELPYMDNSAHYIKLTLILMEKVAFVSAYL